MGSCFGRLVEKAKGVKEVRLLMLGLDNAGKTSKKSLNYSINFISSVSLAILYKLKFNQTVTTIPTAGFNVECLPHKNVKFHVWVGMSHYCLVILIVALLGVGCRWSGQD